jgi:soluble epoxide hydrolase/lipid-phosphate phosphatase
MIENCLQQASVFSLLYATDPELWKTDFCPVGHAAAFVGGGKTTALPSWVSDEEYAVRDRILRQGGYRGPLNWYKAAMRGINLADEAEISPDKKLCPLPTLLVVSTLDYATRADMQVSKSKEWCPQLEIETLDCGHWIQLERPEELMALLERFAAAVVAPQAASDQKQD